MRILSILIVFFCLSACNGGGSSTVTAQAGPSGDADIQVEVTGIADGPALLVGYFEQQQFRVDSSYLQGGKIRFAKPGGYDQGFYLVYFPNSTSLQLLLGEDQQFKVSTVADDLVYATKVEGSLDNELLYENMVFQNDLSPRFQSVTQSLQATTPGTAEYTALKAEQDNLTQERKQHLEALYQKAPNSLFTSFKKAGQNPDLRDIKRADGSVDEDAQLVYYRTDFWNDVNFADERLIRTPVISNKLERYITQLTPQNPDSILKYADMLIDKVEDKHPVYFKYFVNWVALKYQPTKTTLMDAEAVMVHMVQNYFTPDKATWSDPAELQGLQQRASEMAASLVNRKGPDVISTDPNGATRSIYEMKEPYIVVYMYNPVCELCQEETPLLKAYHDRNGSNVGVFAIAIDTDATKWKNYIQKVGMQKFVNVFDPTNRSIYAKYFVDKTPEMYVLNPDRIIIGKNLKTFQVEELINKDRAKRQ